MYESTNDFLVGRYSGISMQQVACLYRTEIVCCINEIYVHITVRRYRFLFNNQPDAPIIQIYSVIKLYMFRATSVLTFDILLDTMLVVGMYW